MRDRQRDKELTRILEARNPTQQEVRVVSKVFGREENNVPRNKDRPLLYFLASIPL